MSRQRKRTISFRRVILSLLGAGIAFELLFLAWVWPDWSAWRRGMVSESALIKDYKEKRSENPKLPQLRWTPVSKAFPKSIKKVFVVAEDSRFYEHGGVDFQAIREAMAYNMQRGKILLGASTISQQTAKNMFLSLTKSPLRKWHELILTYILEAMLDKNEIIHVYLNVAEFGTGIYGLEAAARAYYGVSAYQLSQYQAVELAASLPSPKKNNPKSRSKAFQKRVQRISATLRIMDQYVAQQSKKPGLTSEAIKQELDEKLEQMRKDMEIEAATEVEAIGEDDTVEKGEVLREAETIEEQKVEQSIDIEESGEAQELRQEAAPSEVSP